MTRELKFTKSDGYQAAFPDAPFGLTLVTGAANPANPPGFDQHKRKLLRRMRDKTELAGISGRVEAYDRFFSSFGYECPLPKHLKRTVNSGFPRYNLMVDAHFLAEMCAGILVAVADWDKFDGNLTLDLAEAGEVCLGLGGREFTLKAGEIVLRDEKDIVCVLCQGADEKTRVGENTTNVLFYAYGLPDVPAEYLEKGLTIAAQTMAEFGNGSVQGVYVY
ncbi:MAG: phenylalanine--tRNA ligase beta subunit-related protein [Thermodesulfobacteriota bacterium]